VETVQDERVDLDVAVGTRKELAADAAAAARQEAALIALTHEINALDDLVCERYFALGETKLPRDAYEAHKISEKKRTSDQRKLASQTQKQFDEELALVRTIDEIKQREVFAAAIKSIETAAPTTPRAYILQEPPE